MSKIEKLTVENKKFLAANNLTLNDVAIFFEMKPVTLRNSTAKNKFVTALRRFQNHYFLRN